MLGLVTYHGLIFVLTQETVGSAMNSYFEISETKKIVADTNHSPLTDVNLQLDQIRTSAYQTKRSLLALEEC